VLENERETTASIDLVLCFSLSFFPSSPWGKND